VNKNHENPLVVGLSLGLFAGFLESVSLLAHVAHIDEVSGYPLLALATWGLLGISCGCAVQIRQVTTRSAPNLRGLPTARIALLLMIIATAGELNGNLLHSPATNRIAVNLALVGAALVVWLAIPWIVRPPRLLELFSAISRSAALLASDHGAQAGVHHNRPTGGIHHPDGIYVVAPALEKREAPSSEPLAASRGPDLTLEAITPIVLDLLGMPVALDMRTALPEFVQQLAAPVARIPTYEGEESNTPTEVGVDPALQEQLKSLGYAE
jgi:hypothetical protein